VKELLIKIRALFEGAGTKQAEQGLKDVERAADKASDSTSKVGNSMSSAQGAGGGFTGFIAGASAALTTFAIDAAMKAINAMVDLAKAFVEGIAKAAEFAGSMVDLSARTGQPIEQLVVLKRAFENAGMSADSVGPMLNRLQKALAGINEDGQPTSDILARLGLSVSQLNAMTATDQLQAISTAISALPTPAQQAAAAMELFGKSGGQMLALLKDGAAFTTAAQQVGQLGADTEKAAVALDTFSDAMSGLDDKKMGFFMAAAAQFATELERAGVAINQIDLGPLGEQVGYVVRGAIEVTKEINAWVQWFKQFSDAIGFTQPLIDALGQAIRSALDPMNITGFLGFLRDTGQEAVVTQQRQQAIAEANDQIANSAQIAADIMARIRAESGQVTSASGQAAAQAVEGAGTKASEGIKLTADQLKMATQQITAAMAEANTSGVTPAMNALVQAVQESFARITGELTTAVTTLQSSQAASSEQFAAAVAALTESINTTSQASAQSLSGVATSVQSSAQASASQAQATASQIQSGLSQMQQAIGQLQSAVAGGFQALAGNIASVANNLQQQINYLASRR
jgi:hypothetical protein